MVKYIVGAALGFAGTLAMELALIWYLVFKR